MPVLVNKGDNPTQAAWLFFSPRTTLEGLIATIREHNLVAGVINVDPGDGRPKETVEVHLAMAEHAPEEGAGEADAEGGAEGHQTPADPSELVTDAVMGTTTCETARRYLQPREVDGKPWSISVPDLQGMASFAEQLLSSSPQTRQIIWSIDLQGILRMAPAKDAKPMAGNILRVKL